MTTLEQSIDRLEKTVQNFAHQDIHHKALERPVFETKAEIQNKTNSVQHFVKYGEKALSSQDGAGSLVIRKPSISEIVEKPSSLAKLCYFPGSAKVNNACGFKCGGIEH